MVRLLYTYTLLSIVCFSGCSYRRKYYKDMQIVAAKVEVIRILPNRLKQDNIEELKEWLQRRLK